jgi:alpha-ribazole phosphatase
VTAFLGELPCLPANTAGFGHGVWMALLFWKLLGFSAEDSAGMRVSRRSQIGLPMPNRAAYGVEQGPPGKWCVQGQEAIMRRLAAASDAGASGSVGAGGEP